MSDPDLSGSQSPTAGDAVTAGQAGRRQPTRLSRRRLVAAGVVIAVIAVAALGATELGGAPAATTASTPGTSTATIDLTDLHQTTPVSGTVGFAGSFTIVEPAGNPSAALTKDAQMVSSAQAGLAADRTSQASTGAADSLAESQAQQAVQGAQATLSNDQSTLRQDQATLSADQQKEANDCQGDQSAGSGGSSSGGSSPTGSGSGSGCAADQAKVASDQSKVDQDGQTVTKDQAQVSSAQAQVSSARQKAAQDADQAQSKATADQQALADAQSALSSDSSSATSYGADSKYTALPGVGQIINPGQSLWSVNGQPVLLLPGLLTPWRAFRSGMSGGSDVAVLNRALATLGYGGGLAASDTFSSATAAAIDRMQAAAGLPRTGELDLGAAAFAPTPVRVTAVHAAVGVNVGGGQPVLDVTSTTPVINVALPVDQSYLVKVGNAVTATLPDGSTAPGTITGVGSVATSTTSGSGGNNQPSATVNVTVALLRASSAAALDQAPVTVNITNATADNVLAVPTTALLALAGGGYALEVVEPSGAHQLVAVTTGIFDDQAGKVQVSGSGLAAGQKVVVPAS